MSRDQITSILIRDGEIELTTARRARAGVEIVRSDRAALDGAAPAAADGDAAAAAAAAAARGAAIRKACGKVDGAVIGAIPAARVLMRVIRLPAVSSEERAGMVDLQVDKFAPFPIEQLVVSHEVLAEREGQQDVLIVAAPLRLVEETGLALRGAGLQPAAVDVDILGWWRVMTEQGLVDAQGRAVILLMDAGGCGLIVAERGVPAVFRWLEGPAGPGDQGFAAETAREVQYTLTSLDVECGPGEISQVAVWHRGEAPAGLAASLREALGHEVDARALDSLPPLTSGLARRHLLQAGAVVDLVPPAWRQTEASRLVRRRLIAGSAAALVVWAIVVLVVFALRHVEQRRVAVLEAQLQALQGPANEVRTLRRRVISLQQFTVDNIIALDCLLDIARAQPRPVELKSYNYTREEVQLNGSGEAATPVFEFKEALDKVAAFRAVTLQGPTRDQGGKENFRMTIALKEDLP